MSRAAVVADLITAHARALKMPGVARTFVELSRQAVAEKWSVEDYLHEVLSAEVASRTEGAVRNRLRAAHFPETKTLSEFDFDAATKLDAKQIADLARGAWVDDGDNVIFAGPIGTGKTHLAIALGVESARQRKHVAFYRAADLVRVLHEARDDRSLGRLHRRTRRVDLLILDEVGFVPFDRAGGELLFNLIADRYQHRRSVLVTTNLAFAEWPKVFGGDEKLTTALLDRLAERATIITTRGKSYRMRRRETERADKPKASSPARTSPKNKPTETSRTHKPKKG